MIKSFLIQQSVLRQEMQQLRRNKKRRKRGGVANKACLMIMIAFFIFSQIVLRLHTILISNAFSLLIMIRNLCFQNLPLFLDENRFFFEKQRLSLKIAVYFCRFCPRGCLCFLIFHGQRFFSSISQKSRNRGTGRDSLRTEFKRCYGRLSIKSAQTRLLMGKIQDRKKCILVILT